MSQALAQQLQAESIDEHEDGRGGSAGGVIGQQAPCHGRVARLGVGERTGRAGVAQDEPRAHRRGAQDLTQVRPHARAAT